jgi:transcription termination/antitermination protein NusA
LPSKFDRLFSFAEVFFFEKKSSIYFMATHTPRTEFASALNQVANDRGIDPSVVLDSIKSAILAAYKKDGMLTGDYHEDWTYEVELDNVTGEAKVFGFPTPEVPEGEEPTEKQIEAAKKKRSEVTPPGFGRIAAQTAKQVILQKIREAEKNAIISEYEHRVGSLVNGMILRFIGNDIIVDLGKGEAIMPSYEQTPSENYRLNQRLTFYIESIREGIKGREVVVSRAHKGLVEGLFKREVPEVGNGSVEIKTMAREPGTRTKIAVYSSQSGVDPVGSCVGQKGVRVQAVIEELNNEKIDIIQYSEDPEKFITASLAPAQNMIVEVDEKKKSAAVRVDEDQLSLAIGRDGQNVRLASKLTGYKIDILSKAGKPEAETSVSDEASTAPAEEKETTSISENKEIPAEIPVSESPEVSLDNVADSSQ